MVDKICWWPDYDALIAECLVEFPELLTENEDGSYTFVLDGTPIVRNKAGEEMTLIRETDGNTFSKLVKLDTLHILGTYQATFNAPPKRAIYDRIYDQTPYEVKDDEGNTIIIEKPEMFGVMAGGLLDE